MSRVPEMRPIRHWIFLKLEPRAVKAGDIHLPDHTMVENVAERCARVLAAGPGVRDDVTGALKPTSVQVGDRVLLRGFLKDVAPVQGASWWSQDMGDEYCFVAEPDILAVVPDDIGFGPYNVKAPELVDGT